MRKMAGNLPAETIRPSPKKSIKTGSDNLISLSQPPNWNANLDAGEPDCPASFLPCSMGARQTPTRMIRTIVSGADLRMLLSVSEWWSNWHATGMSSTP